MDLFLQLDFLSYFCALKRLWLFSVALMTLEWYPVLSEFLQMRVKIGMYAYSELVRFSCKILPFFVNIFIN